MGNVILVAVSLAVAVLLSEAGARLFLNPADYLSATTVEDEILGIRIAPGAAGFDAWGFRNRSVPSTARIVAIGDSHTYGNNARMADAWPSVLASVTGWTVYNLGLGGYGPNQYYHLLMTRALKLKPRWIVCGLYMGDDFENAFLMSYGRDHWASLRRERWGEVDADIWDGFRSGLELAWARPDMAFTEQRHLPTCRSRAGAGQSESGRSDQTGRPGSRPLDGIDPDQRDGRGGGVSPPRDSGQAGSE